MILNKQLELGYFVRHDVILAGERHPRLLSILTRYARMAIVLLHLSGDSLKKYLRHHTLVFVAQQVTVE